MFCENVSFLDPSIQQQNNAEINRALHELLPRLDQHTRQQTQNIINSNVNWTREIIAVARKVGIRDLDDAINHVLTGLLHWLRNDYDPASNGPPAAAFRSGVHIRLKSYVVQSHRHQRRNFRDAAVFSQVEDPQGTKLSPVDYRGSGDEYEWIAELTQRVTARAEEMRDQAVTTNIDRVREKLIRQAKRLEDLWQTTISGGATKGGFAARWGNANKREVSEIHTLLYQVIERFAKENDMPQVLSFVSALRSKSA